MTFDNTDLLANIALSACSIAAFIVSFFSYRRVNSRSDWQKRATFDKLPIFERIYKPIQILTIVATLSGIWIDADLFGFVEVPLSIRFLGVIVMAISAMLFMWAIQSLDDQYSPCYDSRIPTKIVTTGPYRFLSHPIYVANIILMLSTFIVSGALFIVPMTLVLGHYYRKCAKKENAILTKVALEQGLVRQLKPITPSI